MEAEGTRWTSGSQNCPGPARVLNRQTPGGGRVGWGGGSGLLTFGTAFSGGTLMLGQLWFQGAEITATGSLENTQKSDLNSRRFLKERKRSAEVERPHGEVLLISFWNWWREVNEQETSLCQLSYSEQVREFLFERCLSKCALKCSPGEKTKFF